MVVIPQAKSERAVQRILSALGAALFGSALAFFLLEMMRWGRGV